MKETSAQLPSTAPALPDVWVGECPAAGHPRQRPGCSASPAKLESPPETSGILFFLSPGLSSRSRSVGVRISSWSPEASPHRGRTAALTESPQAKSGTDQRAGPCTFCRFEKSAYLCRTEGAAKYALTEFALTQ